MVTDRGSKAVPQVSGRGWLVLAAVSLAILIMALGIHFARARDLGQWQDSPVKEWFQTLMMPDIPTAPCCGEADAYWADEIHVKDGKTFATITDDRDDAPLMRPHVDIGTVVEIPPHKIKFDRGNPTGHGIVFLSRGGFVYCFVQPTMG